MSGWSIAWVLWAMLFCVIEACAIVVKDAPGRPATLSAHVWWLVRGAGVWHHIARVLLLFALAWLAVHLLTGWV